MEEKLLNFMKKLQEENVDIKTHMSARDEVANIKHDIDRTKPRMPNKDEFACIKYDIANIGPRRAAKDEFLVENDLDSIGPKRAVKEEFACVEDDLDCIEPKRAVMNEVACIRDDGDNIEQEMDTRDDIVKLETKIENEVIDKLHALLESEEIQTEFNQKMQRALERIELKIDVLQLEVANIRRAK